MVPRARVCVGNHRCCEFTGSTATSCPEDNVFQHSSPNSGSYIFSDSPSMMFSEHPECSNIDVLIALSVWEKNIVLWDIFMCLFTSSSNMKGICLPLSNQEVVFETRQRWLLKFIVSISWDSSTQAGTHTLIHTPCLFVLFIACYGGFWLSVCFKMISLLIMCKHEAYMNNEKKPNERAET